MFAFRRRKSTFVSTVYRQLKRAMAVNALEESLEKAAVEPEHRPHFFSSLLEANIYVVSSPPPTGKSEGLYLQQWHMDTQGDSPKSILPFFSSLENLKEVANEDNHVKLECRTFFEMVKEYPISIVMNPGLPYGKEFYPQEIAGILDGSLTLTNGSDGETPAERHVIPEGSQVILGQPKEYPTKLVDALDEYFQSQSVVEAAYLAQVYIPDSKEPPSIFIGIQTGEEFQSVLQEAIRIQQKVHPEEPVDFVQVGLADQDAVTVHLRDNTEPFFVRP